MEIVEHSEDLRLTKVLLEKIQYWGHIELADVFLQDLRLETRDRILEDLTRRTFIELRATVMAEKLEDRKETVEFYRKWPATWWQQLKEEHFPEWFKRRWPVRWQSELQRQTVHFERFATYPQLPLHFEGRLGEVVFFDRKWVEGTEEKEK